MRHNIYIQKSPALVRIRKRRGGFCRAKVYKDFIILTNFSDEK